MKAPVQADSPKGDVAMLWEFLPADSSRQTFSLREALRILREQLDGGSKLSVLDLGCGKGDSFAVFSRCERVLRWIGLDIDDSPEAESRTARDSNFFTYDGVHIPLVDDSVDLVYSRQVFEHVRLPEPLLAEVFRVLRNGGYLVGSTSQLEPFHSRSFWNFTPYGFCLLLKQAGFDSIVVRPGIDGFSLITRKLLSSLRLSRLFNAFFTRESPLNCLLELSSRLMGAEAQRRNAIKLMFCGHFCFVAQKKANDEGRRDEICLNS